MLTDKISVRQSIFKEMASRVDRLNSVVDICLDEILRLRAIEAEVRAEVCSAQNSEYAPQDCLSLTDATQVRMEAQDPVASANDAAKMRFFRDMTSPERRKVFEVFGIESAVLNEVRSLSDETRLFKHLFAAQQPPAPCQKSSGQPPCTNDHVKEGCEQFPETEGQETHRTLAGLYSKNAILLLRNEELRSKVAESERIEAKAALRLGNALIEIGTLQAKVAEQSAEIELLKTVPMKYRRMVFNAQLQEENVQQVKRIAELEKFQEDAFAAHPNLDLDIEALNQKGNQNVSN